jgi:hypothetical protein
MRLVICILAALTLALPSQAQQRLNCAPRDTVAKALTQKHGEHPVLRGVSGRAMVEVWLNIESGSFSVIITQPSSGLACMMAAGVSMSQVPPPKPGKKS